MKFENRTILITGGTSGIGLEFLNQLSKQKVAGIIITGRDLAKLELIKARFPQVAIIQSDVSDPNQIERLYLEVTQKFPALDMLINNAGIMRNLNLQDTALDMVGITDEIDINLSGTIRMVQRFLPHLKNQPSAAIVNISSGLAFLPFPISPIYSAAKAGIHAYTRVLRLQLKNTNIKVFEVAPPSTETPLQNAFSAIDLGRSSMMKVDKMVSEAIRGIQNNRLEILPGMSKILKAISRVAPGFFLNLMDREIKKAIMKAK